LGWLRIKFDIISFSVGLSRSYNPGNGFNMLT
jgi:hypothetical protein